MDIQQELVILCIWISSRNWFLIYLDIQKELVYIMHLDIQQELVCCPAGTGIL